MNNPLLGIPNIIFIIFGGIYSLLCLGSLLIYRLKQRLSARDYQELTKRINAWWVMVTIIFCTFLVPEGFTITAIGFLSFFAFKEFVSLIPTRRTDHRPIFWAYIAIPLQFYWIYIGWYGMFIIFIPLYMALFLPMRMVLIGNTKGFMAAASTINWLLLFTVFCLSHMAYFLKLPDSVNEHASNYGLILFLVLLAQFNDVMQFTWGKLLGKHPVLSTVSPKKTTEGFIGGLIITTLLAYLLAPYLTPLTVWESIGAGLMIATFGFIGDVSISAVKRDLNIKDSGTLIPGHGGILDRVDSLIYTTPLFFHYVYYLHY
ncbi:phosphatidate cytidylyltransferase [Zooshikella harenae]|uniref:Phosphatidate cytidylyltransferase n=1 Tax=Zooshikella harenae TaxID=2827238 RepID=A0ABS5ZD99_9GAMM|nr:phosphatidate cytidylyltransferase [Zooshikella harenae]MBU2711301.1 phosphatidate cytidylyltransferase [Zooshikella harenae]